MTVRRNFAEVVDDVVGKIPRVDAHALLIARLTWLRLDSWFHPPESPMPWAGLRAILVDAIGEPSEPWHYEISKIVRAGT